MEIRKIQITGGNSYVVSLPKSWVNDAGLKAKDAVLVLPQADMSLLVVPKGDLRKETKSEVLLEMPETTDRDTALRTFISYYLSGYDVIRLRISGSSSGLRSHLKEAIRRKLIGIEIVEETSNGITTQCLSGYSDLPLKKAIERMAIIASGMVQDAVVSLQAGDLALAEEVFNRDDEVDRFYHFIVRQLNMAVRNRAIIEEVGLVAARDCLGYRMAVKSIERVADHAAGIARLVPSLTADSLKKVMKDVAKMSELAQKILGQSVSSLVDLDTKKANDAIVLSKKVIEMDDKMTSELLRPGMEGSSVGWFRLVLESVRRVAEYGSDIAEIAIDLTAKEPNNLA
ncbi:MAG: phosphate uptake regulator PhoU [Nitrososphaerota archaeon]|nr:phosphate uptake regulator PhoU [Nitrososphaerota archaeon]MDG6967292.1 phosphate uptake regulator PhoU [Nitrososphaerota archaeon]MDG6977923.1 phosphate uptake regulator PhoU [Nitrososphaerota archaeon]MDG7005842.1 phosphate uptake regulator PhoU [Nitrososphaerota archaeon]MDG7020843.1 phosphate uptake regulator PhoU [Nitrososphaerota archaeon]